MLYLLLVLIALVPCVIYAIVVMLEVPGMADERFGVLEALPEDIGEWKPEPDEDAIPDAATEGLIRETRLWINPNDLFGRKKMYRQVRYLDPETQEVLHTEKDVRIRRKRIKKT